jgi:hypothetical protein
MRKAMEEQSRDGGDKIHRAHWVNDQLVCPCGSRRFTIFRERVARKVHTRSSHRRRRVAICSRGYKTRIAFC